MGWGCVLGLGAEWTAPTVQLFEFAAGVGELALAVGQPGFGQAARLMRLSEFLKQFACHR